MHAAKSALFEDQDQPLTPDMQPAFPPFALAVPRGKNAGEVVWDLAHPEYVVLDAIIA